MWHEALLGKIVGDDIQNIYFLFVSIDSLFLKVNLRQSLVWRLIWIKVSWSLWEGWRTWMIWFVSWAARWVVYLLITLGCLWGLLLTPWQLGMVLRKYSAKGWPCGSDNISLRVGELHWFVVPCPTCLFILCPTSICQKWLKWDWRRFRGILFGEVQLLSENLI